MAVIHLKLQTPNVPNFIRVEMDCFNEKSEGFTAAPVVSVGSLTDEQIGAVADEWKIALYEKAKQQRAAKHDQPTTR